MPQFLKVNLFYLHLKLSYSNLPMEPWDFIQQNKLDFFEGNVVKYICRWKNKGGVDDLRKAITYIEKIIEGENNNE